jgi:hypothetical protein
VVKENSMQVTMSTLKSKKQFLDSIETQISALQNWLDEIELHRRDYIEKKLKDYQEKEKPKTFLGRFFNCPATYESVAYDYDHRAKHNIYVFAIERDQKEAIRKKLSELLSVKEALGFATDNDESFLLNQDDIQNCKRNYAQELKDYFDSIDYIALIHEQSWFSKKPKSV